MYSLVLVAALTAGEQAPDLFHRGGCHGCYGCNGCCGGCWGCYGGCWGCYGGCYGCYGGCYGACYGSCYGYGFGWGYGAGCYGCCGGSCFGGCYGAAFGCYGGCYGGYGGCWGMGYGCYGSCYGGVYAPGTPAPGGVVTPPGGTTPPGQTLPKPKPEDEGKQTSASKARLIVELPADAKLYIDDKPTKATSARREFNTPALAPGQAYFYDVRAEVVREGRTVSATQRVIIRPGQVYRADFRSLDRTVSTASAR